MSGELQRDAATFAAQRLLDRITRSQVIEWAATQVADWEHHPAIAELAGLSVIEQDRLDELLEDLLNDLGLEKLTEYQAAMLCASKVAQQVGGGHVEPIDAARAIWRIATQVPASQADLSPFIGLASEWDDDLESRSYYDEEIRSRALVLASWPAGLSGSSP